MRYTRLLLRGLGLVLLGTVGCIHAQPDLKPPPQPDVLACPAAGDKRYCEPCNYPPDQLASDPIKKALQNDGTIPLQAPKKTPGFGGAPPGM
jgi:hypothetical protein